MTSALRDGVVPVTVGSPEGSILDAINGGDLKLCDDFVNKPPLSMIAQPAIATYPGAAEVGKGDFVANRRYLPSDGTHVGRARTAST